MMKERGTLQAEYSRLRNQYGKKHLRCTGPGFGTPFKVETKKFSALLGMCWQYCWDYPYTSLISYLNLLAGYNMLIQKRKFGQQGFCIRKAEFFPQIYPQTET